METGSLRLRPPPRSLAIRHFLEIRDISPPLAGFFNESLPSLAETIKRLEDRELERLLTVALHERKRRGIKLFHSDNNPPEQRA
jgi:hypothetical protein